MEQEFAGLLLFAAVVGIPIALKKLQRIGTPSKEDKVMVMACPECGHKIIVTIACKHS